MTLPLMIDLSAPSLTAEERALLAERRVAGVCLFGRNVTDRFQLADYVAEVRAVGGKDMIVAIDQEGGGVVRLSDVPTPPAAMALGAADDATLTEDVAAATARGLRAVGVNLDFAPVADINANPANPVIADRAFGARPEQVAGHVAAFVRGLQRERVGATLKHFPGHGDTDTDSHLALPRIGRDLATLDEVDVTPFRAGIEAGAAAVMSAHIVVPALDPELPGTLSRTVMTGLLRERLGFDGVVITDALDMHAIRDRWNAGEASVMALAAGADLPLTLGTVDQHRATLAAIEAAYAEGRLDAAERTASAARLQAFHERFSAAAWPDPTSAWRDGDEALLAAAARRGLVALGDVPRLRRGDEVVVVAADTVRASAASQVTVRPVEPLERALAERGVRMRRVALEGAAALAPGRAALVVFASTSRTRIRDDEAAAGWSAFQAARRAGVPFLHLALWNPYSAERLPGPALLAFGFAARCAAAVADALLGEASFAVSPVPLETARG